MSVDLVIKAVNDLDLTQLSLENVEILQKMIPTEQEVKNYREYTVEKRDVNLLTEEDKFMMQLAKVDRLASKLSIMNYMGNFVDSLHLISPVRLTLNLLNNDFLEHISIIYYFFISIFSQFFHSKLRPF